MRKLIKCVATTLLAISAWPIFAADNSSVQPLQVGVVPYISARVLVATYEPMRLYLEQVLGRPVKIYTATGFRQFFINAKNGDYDLIITSGHLARLLQKEYQFTPLLRYSTGGSGLVMTALNSRLKNLQDLRGQVIALPDQLSLASIVCITYLHEKGLKAGTDFQPLEVPSFASAILSVQKGNAGAAISAPAALAQMPPELRESVQAIMNTGEFISQVLLVHPRLGKDETTHLNKALLKFGNESNEGKQFFSSTGFGSIVPVTAGDMASLDRYIAETKRLLDHTH
jgi:phosphonate transport system substrate-binding protein